MAPDSSPPGRAHERSQGLQPLDRGARGFSTARRADERWLACGPLVRPRGGMVGGAPLPGVETPGNDRKAPAGPCTAQEQWHTAAGPKARGLKPQAPSLKPCFGPFHARCVEERTHSGIGRGASGRMAGWGVLARRRVGRRIAEQRKVGSQTLDTPRVAKRPTCERTLAWRVKGKPLLFRNPQLRGSLSHVGG